MTLAPGWRCTFTITAGVLFTQAAIRLFSWASSTVATSFSRTGAPLRYATITSRKMAGSVIWSLELIV